MHNLSNQVKLTHLPTYVYGTTELTLITASAFCPAARRVRRRPGVRITRPRTPWGASCSAARVGSGPSISRCTVGGKENVNIVQNIQVLQYRFIRVPYLSSKVDDSISIISNTVCR